jgi:hypothetical protein
MSHAPAKERKSHGGQRDSDSHSWTIFIIAVKGYRKSERQEHGRRATICGKCVQMQK